ncbi:MAG: hypothetical protein JKY66_03900, partial [Spongiibacteraceae bacterium]|nr:hypothetical protein [Spongiibacteraceae bacterium]
RPITVLLTTGILSLWLLASCSLPEPQPELGISELSNVSAVTVRSPGFSIKSGDRLEWRRPLIWVQGESLPESVNTINPRGLMVEIQRQLVNKGYVFVQGGKAPDYEIVAAVILGESEKGAALAELARLYPALGDSFNSLKKGTLMMGIAQSGSRNLVWRSSVQAFIAENPSLSQQRDRVQVIVSSLLKALP